MCAVIFSVWVYVWNKDIKLLLFTDNIIIYLEKAIQSFLPSFIHSFVPSFPPPLFLSSLLLSFSIYLPTYLLIYHLSRYVCVSPDLCTFYFYCYLYFLYILISGRFIPLRVNSAICGPLFFPITFIISV